MRRGDVGNDWARLQDRGGVFSVAQLPDVRRDALSIRGGSLDRIVLTKVSNNFEGT